MGHAGGGVRLRLTFARRLALIVLFSLMAVWLVSVALFAFSRTEDSGGPRTLPAQIGALVDLVENAPADQISRILRAVHSPQFTARIEPGDTARTRTPDMVGLRALQHAISAFAGLGSRAVSVTAARQPGALFSRPMLQGPVSLDIRVALRTGNTLDITARTTVMSSVFGLPVGFGVGLIGLLISVAALGALHREIRPLAQLAAALDRLDPSADLAALPSRGHGAPEIQALLAAFTGLQARLRSLLEARMAMMGGISHDVRTFATRLRLRVEQIEPPQERARAIADIEDMIALLDDALLTSRAGVGELSEEMIDLAAFVAAEVSDRQGHGSAVQLAPDQPSIEVIVLADRVALRRIVSNLVNNAVAYGGCARLAVTRAAGNAILTVDDDGPGIPADQRHALFEPFARLDASRSRSTGGAGLGLAVVQTLVRAHSGTVRIEDAPGHGARLVVTLPVFVETGAAT